ncbi:hypothetical protein HPB48_006875 [Haemaphysalis longicornis]|uniref:Uncharacterized protein n=1 Tax=Haemaphysalis longicornis TaxID=44386 RepID=A0A9J6FG07_HAELO|nr:hypothetical protein HPB48_006875 [Haemaphysalis longicornis]
MTAVRRGSASGGSPDSWRVALEESDRPLRSHGIAQAGGKFPFLPDVNLKFHERYREERVWLPGRQKVKAKKNGRNFNANVGVRGEYDLHRSKNGGRVTGYAEGSQSFGRFNGHSYRGKPQGEVGVRAVIPF